FRQCYANISWSEAEQAVGPDHLRSTPQFALGPRVGVDHGQYFLACGKLGSDEPLGGSVPGDRVYRSLEAGRDVAGLTTACGDDMDIASGECLIAHDAGDVRDSPAISRPARGGDLQRRFDERGECATLCIEQIELGNPPVVIARSVRCTDNEAPAVG